MDRFLTKKGLIRQALHPTIDVCGIPQDLHERFKLAQLIWATCARFLRRYMVSDASSTWNCSVRKRREGPWRRGQSPLTQRITAVTCFTLKTIARFGTSPSCFHLCLHASATDIRTFRILVFFDITVSHCTMSPFMVSCTTTSRSRQPQYSSMCC